MEVRPVPFLSDGEIETRVSHLLQEASLSPSLDFPAVDVDAFIEQALQVDYDPYAELEPHVLGVTTFYPDKSPLVEINRLLSTAADQDCVPAWYEGRCRATKAHEAAHVIFHAELYDFTGDQIGIWEPGTQGPARKFRYFDESITSPARSTDRYEIQANKGMAALLMPATLFVDMTRLIVRQKTLDLSSASFQNTLSILGRELAGRFKVSIQAASIRITTLQIDDLLRTGKI